ncbi:MAG: class I SAM-dependent methyltransferase [Candidatus Sericytochromatia bacterium]|nr:class I SAM-dependent methyltransferase [Candidatus Sericytochromatia bacterium]
MIQDVNQTDFYSTVYNKLYAIGYHADIHYSHSYGLIEYLLQNCEFDTILDVGASTGAAVEKLQYSGKSALGLEVSFEAATRAFHFKRPVLWGCVTKIPFVNNYCDVVMSTDMMEHLREQDVAQAVSEICRVAKKYIAMKICPMPEAAGWGRKVGVENLHLTVKPLWWWKEQFTDRLKSLKKDFEFIFNNTDTFVIQLNRKGDKNENS